MAGYKIKIKDLAEYAQTVGRQAEHAINGVRELREEVANLSEELKETKKVVSDLMYERFTDKEENTASSKINYRPFYRNNKVNNFVYIDVYTLSKNRCPKCGSHHLFYEFHPDDFSKSKVQCKDCGHIYKHGESDVAACNPYEVADELRSEHRILFEENKYLQYEIEKLRKQAAIDASYMVTVEDLMSRLKSREERIEALKQENNKLESEKEELKNYNKNLNEYVDKFFKDMNPNELRACDIMRYELNETEKENKKLLIDNAVLESDNDFLELEIDEYKDKINVLKDEKRNLQKEKEELKKALNIYQNITDLDVTLTRNTAYVRFVDSDDAGRAMVKGDELDALCDAYLKYYDGFRKENEDEKNK